MEIAIKGTADEIAALILEIQERRVDKDLAKQIMNQIQARAESRRNEPVFRP